MDGITSTSVRGQDNTGNATGMKGVFCDTGPLALGGGEGTRKYLVRSRSSSRSSSSSSRQLTTLE